MLVDTKKLVRIQTYAIMKSVTHVSVRNWIKSGKINTIEIDDMTYVILTDEEVEKRKYNTNGNNNR